MLIFSDCIIPKSNSGWLPLGQRPRWHKAHDNSHRLPGPVQTHHTCGETQERWQCHQCAQIVNPCELFTPHLIDWCKLQKVKGLLHGLHQNIPWHKTSAFALLYKHDVRNIRGACGCELHHIVVFGRKGPGFWSEWTRGGNPSNWHREHPGEHQNDQSLLCFSHLITELLHPHGLGDNFINFSFFKIFCQKNIQNTQELELYIYLTKFPENSSLQSSSFTFSAAESPFQSQVAGSAPGARLLPVTSKTAPKNFLLKIRVI